MKKRRKQANNFLLSSRASSEFLIKLDQINSQIQAALCNRGG